MSPATSQQPSVDLDYQLEHFISGPLLPDIAYLFDRVADATVATVAEREPGRVLDVGSGASREMGRLAAMGWEAYALDASQHMLGASRLAANGDRPDVRLVRAIGERLPFDDASLDAVTCQCALDHFGDRHAFMREAARVVKPDGRVIVSLNNFDGLACRLGRSLHPIARGTRLHRCADWPCWSIPPDHTFKGNWDVVRTLGGRTLRLDQAYGISLLTMFYGWGHTLNRVPAHARRLALETADGIAYSRPSLADVIVSVWRPTSAS
jgi:SAM-dependent methyltransferase